MNENNIFTYLISTISRKLMFSSDRKIKKLGLNAQQGRIIKYIYEHQDEGLIQKDLAETFGRNTASITSMLKGMSLIHISEPTRRVGISRMPYSA